MDYKLSYFNVTCAFAAILAVLMYNYPLIFYIFLFVLYSLVLVICGESSTDCLLSSLILVSTHFLSLNSFRHAVLFVQYNRNKSVTIKPVAASRILYNATQ
jgi:hypothetical protein